ncbi:MAG: hypothetical protein AAF917_03665 [Pseudomonadota bacterium]
MKYLIALLLGFLAGVVIVAALLIYNPTAGTTRLSPLSVSSQSLLQLSYSGVTERSIAHTNNGESAAKPYPAKILQLWEAPVRKTDVKVANLLDARGRPVGFGIKYMSDSEASNLLQGKAIVDSAWHVVLPGRGSFFIEQSENYWGYLRNVVLPAHWSSADSWKGNWTGNTTAGPGALGIARVTGGSGEFIGRTADAVEMISARAYSTRIGPVSLEGNLMIELHSEDTLVADEQGE